MCRFICIAICLCFMVAYPGLSNSHTDSVHIEIEKFKQDTNRVKYLYTQADQTTSDSLAIAMDYLDQAQQLAEEIKYDYGLANVFQKKAEFYFNNQFYELAITAYTQAIFIFQNLNSTHKLVACYDNLGAIYYKIGNHKLAIKHFLHALELAQSVNLEKAIAAIYNNLALIHTKINEQEEALDYYNKSLAIKKKLNLRKEVAITYHNIGELYLKQNKYNESEKLFKQCLEICDATGDLAGIALARLQLAILAEKKQHFLVAQKLFNEALHEADVSNNQDVVCRVLFSLGKFQINRGQDDKAIENIEQAYSIAKQLGLSEKIIASTKELSNIYTEQKQYKKALYYSKEYFTEHEQLLNRSIKNEVLSEKLTFQIREKENELKFKMEQQEKERKIIEKERTIKLLFIIGSLLIVLLIFVLLFIHSRYRIRHSELLQHKLKTDLVLKNRDLTQKILNITQLNNKIESVVNRLVKAQQTKNDIHNELNRIKIELNLSQNQNVLQEFQAYFGQIHPLFYNKLLERHPEITSNEKKLCAFLKLNMSTKEIATITNNKPSSIDTARSRLRKKLNLSADVNLSQYIDSI